MLKKMPFVPLALVCFFALSSTTQACYTIIAGKKATADGSVLLAHNEDNGLDDVAGMKKMPRCQFPPGAQVALPGGGKLPQVKTTFAYLILDMPGCDYSNALLNEHGVAIISNNCPSREDRPELTDGGIGGPILRQLVAERARNAREGVTLVGRLIQQFGYTAPGRTLSICDSNEGWMVAMVNGKHWVAARVPDDRVAVIANTYTIRQIDLADTDNFLGSPDIITYAEKRGWYKPGDGPFSFEKAYASRQARTHPSNTCRQFSGMKMLAGEPLLPPDQARLPRTIVPKAPLTVKDIARVLRNHYEGTPYQNQPQAPHKNAPGTICNANTNSSSIFQLRSGMPVEIGAVWWCAFWSPCIGAYCPVYLGTETVPPALGFGAKKPASKRPGFGPAYQAFSKLARAVDQDYANRSGPVRKVWERFEAANYQFQAPLEEYLKKKWQSDPAAARDTMTRHCRAKAKEWMTGAQACLPGD